ncbi:MAG: SDR family NAD(P)-dependent oxidoreductase, partial [Parachlamydia sp.]|nr:SDR family NAD(P)-dependent oxidoreductase [Parachlamydia sp.]
MKKAIVIGASSGIGRELAKILAREGYEVGLAARRTALLSTLQQEIPSKTYLKTIDISHSAETINALRELIVEMDGLDLLILSSGIGYINPELDWQKEKETIDVNAYGACAVINGAMKHFMEQGSGHLVGISSIISLRGSDAAPAYSASKAFLSNYLEGMRKKMHKAGMDISITDIQPGFVDTSMAQGPGLFWVAAPNRAAEQIYRAIHRKKSLAYITCRWSLVAWLMWL